MVDNERVLTLTTPQDSLFIFLPVTPKPEDRTSAFSIRKFSDCIRNTRRCAP
jgi:hypothetical protein